MKRKGISPLIGAVLLIAFTMAVAAILTAWVTTFTQDTADQVGNESERLVECSYAGISIYDAVYDSDDDDLTISVANTGTVDLEDEVSIIAFLNNGSIVQSSLTGLSTGGVEEVTLSDNRMTGSGDLDRVRVTSADCPEVSDETSNIGSN